VYVALGWKGEGTHVSLAALRELLPPDHELRAEISQALQSGAVVRTRA